MTIRTSCFFAILAVLAVILPAQAAEKAAEHAPVRLLILGDSLTAGFGLPAPDNFPSRLQRALRAGGNQVKVINSGVSGDTSAGGRSRLAWALADRPDGVIIELGANDGLRGIDPGTTRANLTNILGRLADAGVPVLLTGMKAPPNLGAEYGAEFDQIFADLAKQFKTIFYPFFLDGVVATPNLNQRDGIHPNKAGVDEIVARILPSVKLLLKRVKGL